MQNQQQQHHQHQQHRFTAPHEAKWPQQIDKAAAPGNKNAAYDPSKILKHMVRLTRIPMCVCMHMCMYMHVYIYIYTFIM